MGTTSGENKPTSLPEYHLAELSTINFQSYSDCRLQGSDHRLCVVFSIIQADPTSGDYNDEKDGADWSSYMSSS